MDWRERSSNSVVRISYNFVGLCTFVIVVCAECVDRTRK